MKKLRLLGLFFGLVMVGPNLGWSQDCGPADGFCCDPDEVLFDFATCSGGPGVLNSVAGNQDPDCGEVTTPDCLPIPIDGGLSLLALAGGGLATAAMRRRREEEEAAAQGATCP